MGSWAPFLRRPCLCSSRGTGRLRIWPQAPICLLLPLWRPRSRGTDPQSCRETPQPPSAPCHQHPASREALWSRKQLWSVLVQRWRRARWAWPDQPVFGAKLVQLGCPKGHTPFPMYTHLQLVFLLNLTRKNTGQAVSGLGPNLALCPHLCDLGLCPALPGVSLSLGHAEVMQDPLLPLALTLAASVHCQPGVGGHRAPAVPWALTHMSKGPRSLAHVWGCLVPQESSNLGFLVLSGASNSQCSCFLEMVGCRRPPKAGPMSFVSAEFGVVPGPLCRPQLGLPGGENTQLQYFRAFSKSHSE